MADTLTPIFDFTLIENNTSATTWGNKTNANWSLLDGELGAVKGTADAALPRAGGVMTGAVRGLSGNASGPGYAFDADADTGFYLVSTDVLGVAAGGASVGTFRSSGTPGWNGPVVGTVTGALVGNQSGGTISATTGAFSGVATFNGGLALSNGTAGAPSAFFALDTDTGLYSHSANNLGVAAGGVSAGRFSSSGWVGNVQAGAGSASSPSISFSADNNTGFYSYVGDHLGVAANGALVGFFRDNGWHGPVVGNVTGLAVPPDPPTANSVGYLGKPRNHVSGGYFLGLDDAGKRVTANGFSVVFIPNHDGVPWPEGTVIQLMELGVSTDTYSIVPDPEVTLYWCNGASTASSTGSRTIGQFGAKTARYSVVELYNLDGGNTWVMTCNPPGIVS